ncbi:MAG: DUF3224 domain-containing protein [Ignavibacteriales bacterium]|nr:MAG: DUF3224 domain-containing protein [Ignavibacteriales bacterium]
MKAKGTYTVKKWDEKIYDQTSFDSKMSKATVEYEVSGEISGKISVEYLMYYKYFNEKDQHSSSAHYIGLMKFEGTLHGADGSFVAEDNGDFENGAANSRLQILSDSGMGNLTGLSGKGRYTADKDGAAIELDYSL